MITSILRATGPLIGVALLAAVSGAMAERADNSKPMQIAADAMRYDDVKQTSVWTGNVIATKGTIVIRGDVVEVREDAEGYQHGTVTGNAKKRAFFRQKRDSVDEFMEGESESIVYDGKKDVIQFVKNAEVRRYRGTTLADEIKGTLIVYENLNDRFSADGSSPVTGVGSGRVSATISPKPAAQRAAAKAESTPK
ncbi:MAG: lipopolysaccharide transport periplasmic protein LptA [Betaproteobacteria bacterium]|nr:lipopolysaccharide transport periplasmic protein LptA [Betaproteobacteria bacterium]